ncbi:MAG TPA: hypothetical protein DCM87_10150 [Planctomycetes bacterium]|nr:hypothetical protein [Planctomycetota bacterium]
MLVAAACAPAGLQGADAALRVRVSWGHRAAAEEPYVLGLDARNARIADARPFRFEAGDTARDGAWETRAGGGDIDGVELVLAYPELAVAPIEKPHVIWSYLLDHSDPDTARRLRADPGFRADPRTLAFRCNREATRGFALTVDQLLREKAFWVPALDIYVAAGDTPPTFEEHMTAIAAHAGARILDRATHEPEATYAQFTSAWEDMGHPSYRNPAQVGPGHIVCLAWDSSIHKFGIDRGAGVWNDYGNPDRFGCRFDFGDLGRDLARTWKRQSLDCGLPVITTVFEDDGVRYEVVQFAYPLDGPPAERRGDIPMMLLGRLVVTELRGEARALTIGLAHKRELGGEIQHRTIRDGIVLEEAGTGRALLSVRGEGVVFNGRAQPDAKPRAALVTASFAVGAGAAHEILIALPSPPVAPAEREKFLALDFDAARAATTAFWSRYLEKGARFDVPEETVNDLVRANLWHALRLPRRRGGQELGIAIDLPYSNFAYDQRGAPWPVNQSVYVDTYIYGMRGYHAIAAEELAVIFRNNQEPSGRIKGFADWGVYTPGMLYSVAMHYLLSRDRASFERLLPQALKALDWCLAEMRGAAPRAPALGGLVPAPLNDLSHEPRGWAFNQAYFSAGVKLLGHALAEIGHDRAQECLAAARTFDAAIEREFGRASMRSPLVQLRDRTWSPYVPTDALASGRLFDAWYPTDVDTGAVHLARLNALDPNGFLATCLLHDHEDNLFLGGLGMANEPVYNQHAIAYLHRDNPEAAIRAFYSMMACAFSRSVLEPVEHRWGWGQYFGPPSTDGAWFELFRRMLIDERDDDSLLLLLAAPRRWLEDGKRIAVERAPTFYGPVSFSVESRAAAGEIAAAVDMPDAGRPRALIVRFRHPRNLAMRSVTVNGAAWEDFDPAKEWVMIRAPRDARYTIVARYR